MNISKKILVTSLVIAGVLSSCTKGFDEINAPENTWARFSPMKVSPGLRQAMRTAIFA